MEDNLQAKSKITSKLLKEFYLLYKEYFIRRQVNFCQTFLPFNSRYRGKSNAVIEHELEVLYNWVCSLNRLINKNTRSYFKKLKFKTKKCFFSKFKVFFENLEKIRD